MSTTKKYFWLKLKNDFFKRHDIRIIESMDNGKDYILFYMKLLVESVSHEGSLRFSESIPYDEKMLSIITNTNIDIVRSAVKVFTELNMMETMDDGTIFLQEVNKMVGYETSDAVRMRKVRAEKKALAVQSEQCSRPFKKRSPELELELEKELEKDNITSPKQKTFKKPTIEEIKAYCDERKNDLDAEYFYHYYEARNWELSNKRKIKSWKSCIITFEKNQSKFSPKEVNNDIDTTPKYSVEVKDGI